MPLNLDINTVIQLGAIVLGIGVLYGKLNNLESLVADFKRTLFGQDGRNGVVGDMIIVKEHIQQCRNKNNNG